MSPATFTRRQPSLGHYVNNLTCPGSSRLGHWWFGSKQPRSKFAKLAEPGVINQGNHHVECKVSAGIVVSTPGGTLVVTSALAKLRHGHTQSAVQERKETPLSTGQLGPHVSLHGVRMSAAIAPAIQTHSTLKPRPDSRQHLDSVPRRKNVESRRNPTYGRIDRSSRWCRSPRSRSHPAKDKRRGRKQRSSGHPLESQVARRPRDQQSPPGVTTHLGLRSAAVREAFAQLVVARLQGRPDPF